MNHPDTLRYTPTHEWVRVEGDVATVGITDHAQSELGDIVSFDLPRVGQTFSAGAPFGAVDSLKASSELYAPVSGEVIAVNEKLNDDPGLVNSSPYEAGWIVRLRMSDPSEVDRLLDAAAYEATLEGH